MTCHLIIWSAGKSRSRRQHRAKQTNESTLLGYAYTKRRWSPYTLRNPDYIGTSSADSSPQRAERVLVSKTAPIPCNILLNLFLTDRGGVAWRGQPPPSHPRQNQRARPLGDDNPMS